MEICSKLYAVRSKRTNKPLGPHARPLAGPIFITAWRRSIPIRHAGSASWYYVLARISEVSIDAHRPPVSGVSVDLCSLSPFIPIACDGFPLPL